MKRSFRIFLFILALSMFVSATFAEDYSIWNRDFLDQIIVRSEPHEVFLCNATNSLDQTLVVTEKTTAETPIPFLKVECFNNDGDSIWSHNFDVPNPYCANCIAMGNNEWVVTWVNHHKDVVCMWFDENGSQVWNEPLAIGEGYAPTPKYGLFNDICPDNRIFDSIKLIARDNNSFIIYYATSPEQYDSSRASDHISYIITIDQNIIPLCSSFATTNSLISNHNNGFFGCYTHSYPYYDNEYICYRSFDNSDSSYVRFDYYGQYFNNIMPIDSDNFYLIYSKNRQHYIAKYNTSGISSYDICIDNNDYQFVNFFTSGSTGYIFFHNDTFGESGSKLILYTIDLTNGNILSSFNYSLNWSFEHPHVTKCQDGFLLSYTLIDGIHFSKYQFDGTIDWERTVLDLYSFSRTTATICDNGILYNFNASNNRYETSKGKVSLIKISYDGNINFIKDYQNIRELYIPDKFDIYTSKTYSCLTNCNSRFFTNFNNDYIFIVFDNDTGNIINKISINQNYFRRYCEERDHAILEFFDIIDDFLLINVDVSCFHNFIKLNIFDASITDLHNIASYIYHDDSSILSCDMFGNLYHTDYNDNHIFPKSGIPCFKYSCYGALKLLSGNILSCNRIKCDYGNIYFSFLSQYGTILEEFTLPYNYHQYSLPDYKYTNNHTILFFNRSYNHPFSWNIIDENDKLIHENFLESYDISSELYITDDQFWSFSPPSDDNIFFNCYNFDGDEIPLENNTINNIPSDNIINIFEGNDNILYSALSSDAAELQFFNIQDNGIVTNYSHSFDENFACSCCSTSVKSDNNNGLFVLTKHDFNLFSNGFYYTLDHIKCDAKIITPYSSSLPSSFDMAPAYPNPFNAMTSIRVSLPKTAQTTIKLYDVLGREVKTVLSRELSAGDHTFSINATSDSGQPLASGVYFATMEAGTFTKTQKIVLLK